MWGRLAEEGAWSEFKMQAASHGARVKEDPDFGLTDPVEAQEAERLRQDHYKRSQQAKDQAIMAQFKVHQQFEEAKNACPELS